MRRYLAYFWIIGGLIILLVGLNLTTKNNSPTLNSILPNNQPQTIISSSPPLSAYPTQGKTQKALVTRVIDGDTIEIEGGQIIRYIGINTPETVDPRSTVECFGQESSQKNKELVEGKEVALEKDISETDKYDRLLRYVYLGDLFINDYLVREGFASVSTYPPDIKYQERFKEAEQEARTNKKGLWSACQDATTSSQEQSSTNILAAQNSCSIKGNISTSGEKIYHLPGQRYYNQTIIKTNFGERMFCTEEEALLAGWRKSKV